MLFSVFFFFPEALLLSPDPKQYVWVCQGVTVVDNMDDGEELQLTDVSKTLSLLNPALKASYISCFFFLCSA